MAATDIIDGLSKRQQAEVYRLACAELARQDLIEFSAYVDPVQEHNYRAAHLRKLADKLEAVERGDITRLFVTMPPRHWKSSLTSEKFPAWLLGRHKDWPIGVVGNAAHLAVGFSRNVRDTVAFNPRYRELFDTCVSAESSAVNDWAVEGSYRSSMRAFGVGTSPVGRGFRILVIDDPVADNQAAFSKVKREGLWEWYRQTIRDRMEPGGAIILIMSRWHRQDLAGMILNASETGEGEAWDTLHLPAISSAEQALWPERWPSSELAKIKKAVGSRAWAARFQGEPKPDEGMVLDSSKLVMVEPENLPEMVSILRRWDLAFSERESADHFAGAKLGKSKTGDIYILHMKRGQGKWPQLKPVIIETAQQDGQQCSVYVEANGTQLGYYDDIKAHPSMRNRAVYPDHPEGSKEMRASLWGTRLEDGIIHCVRGEWNGELFDEMDYFPNAERDDMVDAISGGYNKLSKSRRILVA